MQGKDDSNSEGPLLRVISFYFWLIVRCIKLLTRWGVVKELGKVGRKCHQGFFHRRKYVAEIGRLVYSVLAYSVGATEVAKVLQRSLDFPLMKAL